MVFSLDSRGLGVKKPIRIFAKTGRGYAMRRERLSIRRGDDVIERNSGSGGDSSSSEGLGAIAEEDVDLTGAGSNDRLRMGRDTAEDEPTSVDGESLVVGDDYRDVLSDGDLPTTREVNDAQANTTPSQESSSLVGPTVQRKRRFSA